MEKIFCAYLIIKGMVELVPASDTLRKIQVEYGVTGSFKDKPLAEWLRKYNPTEEEYEKVSSSNCKINGVYSGTTHVLHAYSSPFSSWWLNKILNKDHCHLQELLPLKLGLNR